MTAPLRLYRYTLSGHCHRVELFLHLLGLPYEAVDVDLPGRAHKAPAFLALNAFGQVPVIDDGGTVVADSNAILVYLALRHGGQAWWPREPRRAAEVQRWFSVAAGPLASGPAFARVANVFRRDVDTSAAVEASHRLFAVVEQVLQGTGAWLVEGDHPTLADVALYSYTAHAPEGGVSLADYPALRAWLQRVQALPGFVPMPATAVGLAA